MEAFIALVLAALAAVLTVVFSRKSPAPTPDPVVVPPPTDAYAPKPDTGAPEPKPDERYPTPEPPPETYPEPTTEPVVVPPVVVVPDPVVPPVVIPLPAPAPTGPRVYSAAEQDALFKAVGLPYGTDAKRKSSTWLFQFGMTWESLVMDSDFGPATTRVAERCVAENYRASKYFHLYEFRCKGQDAAFGSGAHCSSDCQIIYIDRNMLRKLDVVRETVYQGPMSITAGYRCDGFNAHVGGIAKSAHPHGLAADIPRAHPASRFVGLGFKGIGKSRVDRKSVVHVDMDPNTRGFDVVFQE